MSSTTPNRLLQPGFVLNTGSITAPSLTNSSLNTAYLNQVVKVGADTYFVDATGKAQKLGSAVSTSIKAKLAPVIDFKTSAQLAALTIQNPGDSYIVTDGANKGDIATWDGAAWQYYAPTDNDQTTVTTGASTGTWQYNAESDTWVQITEGIELPDPVSRPVAGNVALTENFGYITSVTGSTLLLVNDQLAAYSDLGTLDGGDNSAANALPRKISWNWSTLQSGNNLKGGTYAPVFVDGAHNSDHILALDSKGKVWSKSTISTASGLTTTATGSIAVSELPRYALHPVPFFHLQDILVSKVYVSNTLFNNTSNTFSGALSVLGDLYLTGANGWGQLGNGNTTNQVGWIKYPIGNVVEVKMSSQTILVRTLDNNLYFTGRDTDGMFGAAGANITTPVLVSSNVAFFDFGAYYARNVHIVKTDGTYWNRGYDSNGQLGRGSVLATGSRPMAQVLTGAKKVFPGRHDGTQTIVLMTDGTIRVAGNNRAGMLGYTPNASAVNNLTFVVPTGAFQGTVVDGVCGYQTSTLQTADGALWNAGQIQWRGHGITTNIWADNNRWLQVPLPEAVIGFRSFHESATNYEGTVALMTNHKLYGFGSIHATRWTAGIAYGYSPMAIPLYQLDNGISIQNPLDLVITKTGTITSATLQSISAILDGAGNQTVTATIAATGTAGMIALTGSTASGQDVTFNSWTTSQVVMAASSTVITVQFVISAADIPSLVVPNTQAQSWTINLSANGSPITVSGTGLRTTDAIFGALSTSQAAYSAATTGQSVQITAAEYANLMTLTGAAKYGTTDATMAAVAPNGAGASANQTQTYNATGVFNGTYFASSQYLIAFSFKSRNSNTAGMNYQGVKIKWGDNSYTSVTDYTTVVSSVPATPDTQTYYVVKGATISPAVARFGLYQPPQTSGNLNDLIAGGANTPALRYAATGDVSTLSSTPSVVYAPPYIQGIMTATKQW